MEKSINFLEYIKKKPNAFAVIKGNSEYSGISGLTLFYQTSEGVIVATQVNGLPSNKDKCKSPIYAVHIHSGGSCTGNSEDEFKDTLIHYNPRNCEHPYHAGDMPPLFLGNGTAFVAFLTNRFDVKEIIGKTVVIHSGIDDFTTQPSGKSGTKIACGVIKLYR